MTTQQTQRGIEYRLIPSSIAYTKKELSMITLIPIENTNNVRLLAKPFSTQGERKEIFIDIFTKDELRQLLEAVL